MGNETFKPSVALSEAGGVAAPDGSRDDVGDFSLACVLRQHALTRWARAPLRRHPVVRIMMRI